MERPATYESNSKQNVELQALMKVTTNKLDIERQAKLDPIASVGMALSVVSLSVPLLEIVTGSPESPGSPGSPATLA